MIQLSDGTFPRIILDGVNGKFVISRPGFDANSATDAQSIVKVDSIGSKLYFSKTFSSPSNTSPDAFTGAVSAIIYDSASGNNAVLILDFYKSPAWNITSANLQLRFVPQRIYSGGVQTIYQTNIKGYINPTETVNNDGISLVWLRYSGGTTLRMDGQGADAFNLSSTALTFTDTFGGSEIAALTDGWNRIILQTDNNDGNFVSYGTINLNLIGYETVT